MARWRWSVGLFLVLVALGLSWFKPSSAQPDVPAPASRSVGSAARPAPRAVPGAPGFAPDTPLTIRGTTLNLMERPLADVELLALRVPEVSTPWRVNCEGLTAEEQTCVPEPSEFDAILDEIESSAPPEVFRSRSSAEGQFEVGGLRPGLYEVWAEAPHGVAVQTLAAGTEGARLILEAGVLAGGRVEDWAEVPLAGVRVALWSHQRVRRSMTRTSKSGHYAFFRVPQREYHIVSSKEGFLSSVVSAHQSEYAQRLSRPRTIEGRVVRQGVGLGGVQVQLVGGETSGRTVSSDPDGRFSFDELSLGSYSLEAVSEQGWASAKVSFLSEGPPGMAVLDLQPCAGLEGRVVEEWSRQPIAGAVARFLLKPSERGDPVLTRAVTTDSMGFFRFECPPLGSFKLSVTAKGFMESIVADVQPLGAGASRRVEVTLESAVPFEGRVVDPEGHFIEGVRVGVQWMRFTPSHAARLQNAPPSVFSTWSTTGAEGAFTLEGLGPGYFVLHILAPPGFKNGSHEVTLPLTGARFVLERDTAVPGTVRGVVVDELGRPRSRARVMGVRMGEDPVMVLAWTDALGMFRFDDLPVGPLTLSAQHPVASDDDFVGSTQEVEVRGADAAEVRFELPEGQNLAVLVVDERGAPLEGLRVSFYREEPDIEHGRYVGDAWTRAQGRAELRHLRPGSYFATVEADGWQSSEPVRLGSGGLALRIVLRPAPSAP
ncbi:carboxypeptidase-like regulatory domain-containing protein [Myxococcaceae bacterium GXIMD 01537]